MRTKPWRIHGVRHHPWDPSNSNSFNKVLDLRWTDVKRRVLFYQQDLQWWGIRHDLVSHISLGVETNSCLTRTNWWYTSRKPTLLTRNRLVLQWLYWLLFMEWCTTYMSSVSFGRKLWNQDGEHINRSKVNLFWLPSKPLYIRQRA